MAELERQADEADPIASLHKMSTTAGISSGEYVAINLPAVFAALLGLATALAFLGLPFLAVGAGGIVCGVVALRQIHGSNGTQGGAALAWGGIVVSLALAGTVFYNHTQEQAALKRQQEQVNATIQTLGKYLSSEDYAAAYGLMAPELQQRVDPQTFVQAWKIRQEWRGPLRSVQGNDRFAVTKGAGTTVMYTKAIFRFGAPDKPFEVGYIVALRLGDDGWRVLDIPDVYPRQKPKR